MNYYDYNELKVNPTFRRAYVPKPADMVEVPDVLVTEGEAAAASIERHQQTDHWRLIPWEK